MNNKENFQGKIVKCVNPKCITNHETYAKPSFKRVDKKSGICLCEFCSAENRIK